VLGARRSVCGAPRGIAYEETTDRIHVACAGGDLVSFPAGGGDAVRRLKLDVDLRDVVVQGDRLVVSRFKSGEILFVDADGNVTGRTSLHGITRKTDAVDTIPAAELVDEATSAQPMQPAVAWRTIASPTGALFVLHQYGLAAGIDLNVPPSNGFGEGSGNAYGSSMATCAALVQPAVSRVDGRPSMGMPIAEMGLTVDAAVSVDGELLALVDASTGRVKLVQSADILAANSDPTPCARPTALNVFSSQPIAVAFNPIDDLRPPTTRAWLVVQTRQPARVVIFGDESPIFSRSIDLGGEDVSDTGHELFHKLTAAQIACASCHSEGGEDGRVWKFVQTGDRRTQAVHTGLKGTEPFHWDGDMTDFGMLVTEVMVHRMGGAPQSLPRQAAFERWLFQLRPPAAIVAANDDRALRGRALFESVEVGCSGCHAGSKLTNNQSVFVGTTTGNHPLQVPSLRGVGFRAPFLHDGCAATLRGRFDPACGGGDLHGKTSQLNEAQIGDLLAYLESL
jgi:mono/diheme cytochrome c family protein